MSNELGIFIREQRGEMSLREFASKCGISHTHLDSIEKGLDPRTGKPVSISTETLRLIANGIGVNFVFLACLADGYNPNEVENAVIPVLSPQVQELIKEMKKPNKKIGNNQTITTEEEALLQAYRSADNRTRTIVDAALEPYNPPVHSEKAM